MILVLSQKDEKSTDEVLFYMRYLGIEFVRINEEDILRKIEINFIEGQLEISFLFKHRRIHFSDITGYWYRRGKFNFRFNEVIIDKLLTEEFTYYRQYFDREFEHINSLIHEYLRQIPHINSFDDNFLSKLNQLYWAKHFGIKIPNTLITNNKSALKQFFISSSNEVIIKSIRTNVFKKHKENYIENFITNHIIPVTEN